MHKSDIIALLTRVIGIGAIITDVIGNLQSIPMLHISVYLTMALGVVGLLSTVATDLIRFLNNPTPKSIDVAGAIIHQELQDANDVAQKAATIFAETKSIVVAKPVPTVTIEMPK